MNKKVVKIIGAILFLAALNTGLFLLAEPSETAFWISWAFIHLSFAVWVGIVVFSAAEQKRILSMYSEAAVATYYFVIELIVGLIFGVFLSELTVVAFIVQLIILAVYLCVFFALKGTNKNIEQAEAVRKVELYNYKFLLEAFKDVMRKVAYDAPYKKAVEHAYDAMAGSQMHSTESAAVNEENILSLTKALKEAISANDEAKVLSLCEKIEDEIAERNSKLRLG